MRVNAFDMIVIHLHELHVYRISLNLDDNNFRRLTFLEMLWNKSHKSLPSAANVVHVYTEHRS